RQSSPEPRRSALRSGIVTGLALVVLGGSGAAGAAYLAQKFGRSAETDGLLAGYAVYLVLTIAAQSFRFVVLPDATRAAATGRPPLLRRRLAVARRDRARVGARAERGARARSPAGRACPSRPACGRRSRPAGAASPALEPPAGRGAPGRVPGLLSRRAQARGRA